MARPRKPEDDKLVPVSTCLPRRELAAIARVADLKGVKVAHVLRVLITRGFRQIKTDAVESSLTL